MKMTSEGIAMDVNAYTSLKEIDVTIDLSFATPEGRSRCEKLLNFLRGMDGVSEAQIENIDRAQKVFAEAKEATPKAEQPG